MKEEVCVHGKKKKKKNSHWEGKRRTASVKISQVRQQLNGVVGGVIDA
jgi:hypothetical protein